MKLKRLHFFEFEDLDWFPALLRNLVTDYLYYMVTTFRLYSPVVPCLYRILKTLNCRQIVDLGSGRGGPLPAIGNELMRQYGYRAHILLTDKFPSAEVPAGRSIFLNYYPRPVEAGNVPANLRGFRTLFNTFHHFRPETAVRILQNAVSREEGIAIFELTGRKFLSLLYILFSPLAVLLVTPFIKPFRRERLLFTYLLPVVPFIAVWDGMVSNFRTYSPEELKRLLDRVESPGYCWEIFSKRNRIGMKITGLIGAPATTGFSAATESDKPPEK